MTTTYIDGLFEQAYDSSTGNLTYRHYILAGGARVGVETINANSGGTITSDTLSFYVRDEVGSVIATVTESLGGANQVAALTSYDAWGNVQLRAPRKSRALPGHFLLVYVSLYVLRCDMGQVTIYLDKESEKQMKRAAKSAGVPMSRWLADLVREKTRNEWPKAVREAAGVWADFPDADELRKRAGRDTAREAL